MKQLSRIFLTLALLVPAVAFADDCNNSCATSNTCNTSCNDSCNTNCATSCESSCYCPTVFIKRPTYDNTVIQYGLEYQHRYDMDQVYGGFQLAFEYQRSFNSANLARGMFGSNVLNFAGSQVASPAANSLLADNFGLSQTFQGSIALKPIIQDFNLFFDWFVGFDEWAPGLYMQLDMNFDYQKRQLQYDCACTSVTTTGAPFPAGYMNASTSSVTPITDIPTALGLQQTFGDKKTPGTFGRFDFCDRTESGLAGLSVNLGYDFLRCDDYFLGAFFRVVAPTGSSVKPCYVFDALVGNGKGWELGAGMSGRWELWNNNDCQKLTLMLDGYVTSVLKHHSLRTFDLASTNTALRVDYTCANSCNNSCNTACSVDSCNVNSCNTACSVSSCNTDCSVGCSTGCSTNNSCDNACNTCNAQNCLTRYNLLKQYNLNGDVYTYANNLITAADFTTRNVEVRTPAKGEATLRMVYTHGGFDLGFGYNVFGMVREKISSVGGYSSCLATTTATRFAVKGCQGVAYNQYVITSTVGVVSSGPISVPLINSANNSTAYVSGTCGNACGPVDNEVIVASAGTSLNVAYNSAPVTIGENLATVFGAGFVPPYTSGVAGSDLVVLDGSVNELDLCSGTAPRQFTNKGFISLDYTWVDNDWAPYLGFIAEVEGGSRNLDLAQWGLVIRGGVSY
ncbi:MAG: hypothetical protein K2X90_01560 [Candidatus Babeliaceae bacterium]|nr:hypothetical protein [Candidatus Babeliaceae bacterium]